MGHNTYKNLYDGKPRNKRINIVLSSYDRENHKNLFFCKSKKEALLKVREHSNTKVYIIGGKQIYELFRNDIKEMILKNGLYIHTYDSKYKT